VNRTGYATAQRVPEITAFFWGIKLLTTALGESSSDYLVHALPPELAVVLGFVAFAAALTVQLRQRRYVAWAYWLAVAMVGIFGTMAADVVHVGLGVPYVAAAAFYGAVLAAVFLAWRKTEGTLSIHSIDSRRRELFYWSAVVATFAFGTAFGDLTAVTLRFGYAGSILFFVLLILLPVIAALLDIGSSIAVFWTAYVLTRPLGASVADYLGKPHANGGLGAGGGLMSVVLSFSVAALVALLAWTKLDEPKLRERLPQQDFAAPGGHSFADLPAPGPVLES